MRERVQVATQLMAGHPNANCKTPSRIAVG